jgi:hypothetical protein
MTYHPGTLRIQSITIPIPTPMGSVKNPTISFEVALTDFHLKLILHEPCAKRPAQSSSRCSFFYRSTGIRLNSRRSSILLPSTDQVIDGQQKVRQLSRDCYYFYHIPTQQTHADQPGHFVRGCLWASVANFLNGTFCELVNLKPHWRSSMAENVTIGHGCSLYLCNLWWDSWKYAI